MDGFWDTEVKGYSPQMIQVQAPIKKQSQNQVTAWKHHPYIQEFLPFLSSSQTPGSLARAYRKTPWQNSTSGTYHLKSRSPNKKKTKPWRANQSSASLCLLSEPLWCSISFDQGAETGLSNCLANAEPIFDAG